MMVLWHAKVDPWHAITRQHMGRASSHSSTERALVGDIATANRKRQGSGTCVIITVSGYYNAGTGCSQANSVWVSSLEDGQNPANVRVWLNSYLILRCVEGMDRCARFQNCKQAQCRVDREKQKT